MPVIDDATLSQLREQLAQAEMDADTFCDDNVRLRALLQRILPVLIGVAAGSNCSMAAGSLANEIKSVCRE